MPANIEIKAKARNFARQQALAAALSESPGTLLFQEDTFFHIPRGRLKLRLLSPAHGELIYYEREDTTEPTPSQYTISPTHAPEMLRDTLAQALGVRGVVRKQRRLYLLDQTRLHLDVVEGLGAFLELEWVMRHDQTVAEGTQVVTELMQRLELTPADLIEAAYIDLLTTQQSGAIANPTPARR